MLKLVLLAVAVALAGIATASLPVAVQAASIRIDPNGVP